MQRLMRAMHKNEKGFTLVELMVVVVIIGILVAIAIPIYSLITQRAEFSTMTANVRIIDGAIGMAIADDNYTTNTAIDTPHDVAELEGDYIEPVEQVGTESYHINTDDRAFVRIAGGTGEGGLADGDYTLTQLLGQ